MQNIMIVKMFYCLKTNFANGSIFFLTQILCKPFWLDNQELETDTVQPHALRSVAFLKTAFVKFKIRFNGRQVIVQFIHRRNSFMKFICLAAHIGNGVIRFLSLIHI